MSIHAWIALAGLAQDPATVRDAAAIDSAKHAIVQAIDPALPRVSFEAWLRGVVGTDATATWEVNDCGEQTGDPQQDQGRDFPMCAEVQVELGGRRALHVSFLVGTFKKGVSSAPALRDAYVRRVGGAPESIARLGAIPSLIRSLRPQ